MRYRRLSYRYTEIVSGLGPGPLGDPWQARLPVTLARTYWRPPVDLYETETALIVKTEVAGMAEEDFDVLLYEDTLVIEGTRPWEQPAAETRFHAVEVRYGPFRVEVPIRAPIDRDRVEARYERGFLVVTLPKAEERTP